jgi:peptide/nickel transport system substrate-binding protein
VPRIHLVSRTRLISTLLAVAVFACAVVGSAPARTQTQARYGGTLVVGIRADPDALDPTVSRLGASIAVYRATCEQLYDLDAKLQLRPVLAAAVPARSKDKLSYTIQLRKGIQFNDGTPFNAQAVVTTVQRFMTYPGSSRASDFAGVASVAASGPYTVVFRMKARDSTFTGNAYVLSPTQLAKLGDNFASKPICVGPFMFDHRVVGDNVTVVKSPYYYDQKDVYLDKIVYRAIPDAAAALAALKAGDIQVLDQILTTDLPDVLQNSSLRVIQGDVLAWFGITINIGNRNGTGNLPYAKDVGTPLSRSGKLRQAFEEAIDRDTMVKVVYDSLQKSSCTPIPPADTAWYDATKVPCTPYNPKHAMKLVAESGFPNPTVHLLTPNRTNLLRLAQFIQAQEAAVGINVVIDPADAATALARAASGNFDTLLFGLSGDPDPNTMISPFAATSGSQNYAGYSNPRLDLILSNGLKATNIQARSTLYNVAQRIIQADRPIIVLTNQMTLAAFSANVAGVQLNASGSLTVAHAQFR